MSNIDKSEKKLSRKWFWRKTPFIVTSIFIFPPLGIYLLYKHNSWMPKRSKLALSFIGIAAWFIFALSAIISTGDTSETPSPSITTSENDKEYTDWISLIESTKSNIKKTLKAPSTAEFPGSILDPYEGWQRGRIGDIVSLESHVDSQNSYGAMLRNEFTIKYKDVGEKYTLLYVEVDGQVLKNDL